jgi:hypothetical protein
VKKQAVKRKHKQAASTVRLARVAKGKRPQYFSDPAIDKLLAMTISLMEELSVTRDRLDTVERLLERKRLLPRTAIERFSPVPAVERERATRRAAFVDRVMRIVQAELQEMGAKGATAQTDEAVAAVES